MQHYIFLVICISAALLVAVGRHQALQPFLSRGCQGSRWHRAFPHASSGDIRTFLNIFGSSFGFRQRHLLKFAPTDSLMQIHKASNPLQGVDAFEFEFLAAGLQNRYNVSLQSAWRPGLTLGELFALVHGNAP